VSAMPHEGHAPAGHYRFRHAARMEWIKLRSLRSTWWTLAITVTGAVAIGVTVGVILATRPVT
jgi:ABC-2 type transport system permease protein